MNNQKIKIGTDIEDINRFRRKPLKANIHFYNSIFTKSELNYCLKYEDPYTHLAGIFAAKEAVIKCSERSIRMLDVKIARDAKGKPGAVLHYKKETVNVNISISHSRSLAIAVAIMIDDK